MSWQSQKCTHAQPYAMLEIVRMFNTPICRSAAALIASSA